MNFNSIFIFSFFFSVNLIAKDVQILFIGDSLTEGLGVPQNLAYPKLVEQKFVQNPNHITCTNAGSSGVSGLAGVESLAWQQKAAKKFDIVFLALGANNGLKGKSNADLEQQLQKTVNLAVKNKMKVVIAGMRMPANYGKKLTTEFAQTFEKIAKKNNLPLLPFLLLNVAAQPKLNISDGIHPNAEGHKIIAQSVYDFLMAHAKELGI